MANTVLYVSMSLDGFIAGPYDDRVNPLGVGGERLHDWFNPRTRVTTAGLLAEMDATGAVLTGRRTYDLVEGWGGSHHGVPVFIVTHKPPSDVPEGGSAFTFVTDGVDRAVALAKQAAGDDDVLVHGADLARQLLAAGLLDEIQLHLVPVLLGDGRRMFDLLGPDQIELGIADVIDERDVTHLRYRVARP